MYRGVFLHSWQFQYRFSIFAKMDFGLMSLLPDIVHRKRGDFFGRYFEFRILPTLSFAAIIAAFLTGLQSSLTDRSTPSSQLAGPFFSWI